MKNVTVTMPADVARWARVEAAKAEMSLARWLGHILKERMERESGYAEAARRAANRTPMELSAGEPYPSREELHDRAGLR
jgi:hypothetical protein